MERRMRGRRGQASPERTKISMRPSPENHNPQKQGTKIPVVYYLCQNRHLEHPHFIEVPISSPEGLYLRDVIHRLNVLRGKGMAAMYSWSCKRSYKNGFVWHDLSEDDLVVPAHGNEYVLKGSAILDQSSSDRTNDITSNPKLQNPEHPLQEPPIYSTTQEITSASSYPVISFEAKSPSPPPISREDEHSPIGEYRVYNPNGAQDASTQTEPRGGRRTHLPNTRPMDVLTDDGSLDIELNRKPQTQTPRSNEIDRVSISLTPTSSSVSSSVLEMDTLESLIRAEVRKMNSFTVLKEGDVLITNGEKLKAGNTFMQLLTCGSISVKDHRSLGFIPTYMPRFSPVKFPSPLFSSSMVVRELDCLSENSRATGIKVEEKDYLHRSLVASKMHAEAGKGMPPFYNEDRIIGRCKSYKSPDSTRERETVVDSVDSKCLPRTLRITSGKLPRNETMTLPMSDARNFPVRPDWSKSSLISSPDGVSKRISEASSVKASSMRLDSLAKEEKVIKIEES